MPGTHGKNTCVAVDDADLSQYFNDMAVNGEVELVETTTFTAAAKSFIIGYRNATASLKGLFSRKDPSAPAGTPNQIADVLEPMLGDNNNSHYATLAQEGFLAFGKQAIFGPVKETKFSVTSPIAGVVSVMSELQADGGFAVGPVLAQSVSRTVTGNSAAYDLGAATTGGFVAQMHGFAFGATTSVVITVEDSADGSTGWATIGTFTSANAAGAQRISVAGNVRRYVRAKWTFTGSNGATFIVSFALGQ